ncbi:two-component hybrid sensor and regulator [Alcanivorax hongdengensis A-11-3]|uniref:Two-component hybrid sensor and regulator n=1 Tax=Alcanivorax hongdengensis A-11-3 TaxID=1177179 RepID=L0W9E8_9GAMM|nr:Hpt domain-containing protein [Alcanivorax hongdengensis]EKF73576.1 two-component hybrid sensor and regulator [Alcanivorax hongdengensis A-11-3]
MQDVPILDNDIISELRDIMGDDFEMLVLSFQRDGEQRLAALHKALKDNDSDVLRRQAHSFKGSSGNLGALQVSRLCMTIEQHAADGDLAPLPALVEQLESAFSRACEALEGL